MTRKANFCPESWVSFSTLSKNSVLSFPGCGSNSPHPQRAYWIVEGIHGGKLLSCLLV